MLSKYSVQYDTERLNPEFRGISERYARTKGERKGLEDKKRSLERSLHYERKMHQTIDTTLLRKKQQLKYLKSVRERHLSDIKQKLEQEDRNNQMLEELRMKSSNAKIQSKQHIEQALMNNRREKMQAKMKVMEELNEIRRMRQERELEQKLLFESRAREQEEEKSSRRSRINHFYRKKNKFVLNNYRTMLKDEEIQSNRSRKSIEHLEVEAEQTGKMVQKKKIKLNSVEKEILRLKEEARGYNLTQWSSVEQSRISRKSSSPSKILKQSLSSTFEVN